LGDIKAASAVRKYHSDLSKEAKNEDYIKMNEKLLKAIEEKIISLFYALIPVVTSTIENRNP
jgi:hypothetical protein